MRVEVMTGAVLISGLLPHESGKTYFTASLAKALKSAGYGVAVFKPVAAHSIWYQLKVFRESVRLGVLVGEDVLKYMDLGFVTDPDLQNPVDILTAVPDVTRFVSIDSYLSTVDSAVAQAVLARVSFTVRRYFLVEDVLGNLTPKLKEEVKSALSTFKPLVRVSSSWLTNYLSSREVDAAVRYAAESLLGKADVVLIESFSSALLPSASLAPYIRALVIVTPSRAMVYSGSKLGTYVSAIKSVNELDSRFFARLLRPDAVVEVPPSEYWPPPPLRYEALDPIVRFLSTD